jgi:branched-chain amino acid transport system ATP-binding protein
VSNQSLLEIEKLHGGYDAGPVLHGIDLNVGHGAVTALLGRNGMGKTSTIRAVMGLLPQASGTIRFAGQDIAGISSHRRARLGIGLVPEARQVFPSLTVREHLEVAARRPAGGARPRTTERLMDLFPVLRKRSKAFGNNLSGGEQQLLVIARALSTNPALLLLDEPTEGLAPSIVKEIADLLRSLRREPDAPAILLVEQNLRFALSVADRAVVLVNGTVAYEGTADELSTRRDVQQSLIGLGVG